jgi:phosphate transport system protein
MPLTSLYSPVNAGKLFFELFPGNSMMTRTEFDREIQAIRSKLLELTDMVKDAMLMSMDALRDNDTLASRGVIEKDKFINQKRFELEETILAVMATQQPAARDLRILTSSLNLSTELERMGDYAKGIANINIQSGGLSLPKILIDLHLMGEKVVEMLARAVDAYMQEDASFAGTITKEDDIIDGLYQQVYFEAMDLVIEDARNVDRINFVLWTAHNIERFADRVTNICERTVFVATGELQELHLREHDFPARAA